MLTHFFAFFGLIWEAHEFFAILAGIYHFSLMSSYPAVFPRHKIAVAVLAESSFERRRNSYLEFH